MGLERLPLAGQEISPLLLGYARVRRAEPLLELIDEPARGRRERADRGIAQRREELVHEVAREGYEAPEHPGARARAEIVEAYEPRLRQEQPCPARELADLALAVEDAAALIDAEARVLRGDERLDPGVLRLFGTGPGAARPGREPRPQGRERGERTARPRLVELPSCAGRGRGGGG